MLNFLFLFGGIIVIILSANWLVDGASSIARKLGVSDLVVGLTIVAFGTSAPELTVNIFSAIEGSTDIAIGNVLGSNIANIFLILGISSVIYPIVIRSNTIWKEIPLSLLAAVVLAIIANDQIIDNHPFGNLISRTDSLILLAFFIIFLVYSAEITRDNENTTEGVAKLIPIWKSVSFVVVGLIGLFFGGKYLVKGAVEIATMMGLSERLIGITIIAVGTSLPELATSVVAAFKKNTDIAVGNVVGSNIFNIFFILGVTAFIKPLPFNPSINFDIFVAILASLLLFAATFTLGRKRIDRWEGVVFILLYIAYLVISITI